MLIEKAGIIIDRKGGIHLQIIREGGGALITMTLPENISVYAKMAAGINTSEFYLDLRDGDDIKTEEIKT